MGKLKDLTGERFGSLVVKQFSHIGYGRNAYWICECDCGEVCIKNGHSLRRGNTTTCGTKRHNENRYIIDGDTAYCILNDGQYVCELDAEDIEKVKPYTWHFDKGYVRAADIGSRNKQVKMHRLIMNTPDDLFVDHINHNGLDNKKSNLRNVTHAQNAMNTKPRSDHHGITWHKQAQKWRAQISVHGKNIGLGCYSNMDDAIKARKRAEELYYGEFRYSV